MTIEQYFEEVAAKYRQGIATEHTYRTYLQQLIESIATDTTVTNEPKRVKVGAPDYILTKKEIPIGYIEAKDIIPNILDRKDTKAQVKKYFGGGLGNNFILTDYLEFRFYREDELVDTISIGTADGSNIEAHRSDFKRLQDRLLNFTLTYGQTIKSSSKLASMMAAKARMIKDVIFNALHDEDDQGGDLRNQLESFRRILIHDMTEESFADVYAQTITYGLFAARLNDYTLEDFSRMEAAELLPKTNPFLRQLFGQIGALDLDDRLVWIVDDLVEVFRACNVREILAGYGKASKRNDPIVHFYEDFLAEYDSKLRKARGVWYTPEPVVDFIVRAVDEVLKTEFGLADGLADTSKTTITVQTQTPDKRTKSGFKEIEREIHKVQVLDPATGTGTFLARVIQEIHSKMGHMPALWNKYVNDDLLPRIHGFELLMASYAMAHLKLDLALRETGAEPKKRLSVYLTNSLEEAHPDTGTLFSSWLSRESDEANRIKKDMPIMCVIGNPPYSISSSNKSAWIEHLMKDYKKDLNERNINPLSDDYIKFIRFAENFIEKRGKGVFAYISNNSFIDGIIHRQMRKHLLESFEKIYIFDLHGSSKKREITKDGTPDKNVFDIQQGVCISLMVKTSISKTHAEVYHRDFVGKREEKYHFLEKENISEINWTYLNPISPNYFFIPFKKKSELYNSWLSIHDLFPVSSVGSSSQNDNVAIHFTQESLKNVLSDFTQLSEETLRQKYQIKSDSRDWVLKTAIEDIKKNNHAIGRIMYRPFDNRFTLLPNKSKGFIAYSRPTLIHHLNNPNYNLLSCRQQSTFDYQHVFISRLVGEGNSISLQTKERTYCFPLYVYKEKDGQLSLSNQLEPLCRPNFNNIHIKKIENILGLKLIVDQEIVEGPKFDSFSPLNLLDYIYAILHSPKYRQEFKSELKIDFPKIPYPADQETFWQLGKLGEELRQLHLMESPKLDQHHIRFDGGDNMGVERIGKKSFDISQERVYINDEVYFEGVPLIAWEFYVGGFQPAQKWLKDRQGRELSYDDVKHYMRIIKALTETDRIMKEIDEVDFMGE